MLGFHCTPVGLYPYLLCSFVARRPEVFLKDGIIAADMRLLPVVVTFPVCHNLGVSACEKRRPGWGAEGRNRVRVGKKEAIPA